MAANKGSKNNISNRGKGASLKELDGKIVKAVMYKGEKVGHGNYMAAKFENGPIIKDSSGKPIAYKTIH